MLFSLPLQLAGPILALVTFLTIWWGHIMVRIVHYYFGVRPAPIIFGAGLLLLLGSTQVGIDVVPRDWVSLASPCSGTPSSCTARKPASGRAMPLSTRVCIAKQQALSQPQSRMIALARQDEGGVCLSCGSTETSRYLCRRGPYCKVHNWDRYRAAETVDTATQ